MVAISNDVISNKRRSSRFGIWFFLYLLLSSTCCVKKQSSIVSMKASFDSFDVVWVSQLILA